MPRETSETLLISSLINTGQPARVTQLGIQPQFFNGYREVYEWLVTYIDRYDAVPSATHLKQAFPEFPYSVEETDPRWSAEQVFDQYAKRNLLRAVTKASTEIQNGNTKSAYDELKVLDYRTAQDAPSSLLNDPGYFEDYEKPEHVSTPVPWSTLQNLTGGIAAGELWLFAARPSQGKTSCLVNMAVQAAISGQRVIFYSLEMNKRQVQARAHAVMGHRLGWGGRIDLKAMTERTYDPTVYRSLIGEIGEHIAGSIDIYDPGRRNTKTSTTSIANKADEYDLMVVDYIGLCCDSKGRRSIEDWRVAAEISNEFKEIALRHETRILSAVQINREGDNIGWKPPTLSQLSQTDALGQDADRVITMKRYGQAARVYSLEKNRHGESSRTWFSRYDINRGDMDEIDKATADDLRDEFEDN